MIYEPLSQHVSPDVRDKALEWANRLRPRELPIAMYRGMPLGRWVMSSVQSALRVSALDWESPEVVSLYREFLYAGAIVCDGVEHLVETYKPDVILLFNGRLSLLRVAFEIARRKNIRVIIHERGAVANSWMIAENETCLSTKRYKQMWLAWGNVPLLHEEIAATHKLLRDRRMGLQMSWVPFTTPPMSVRSFYRQLRLKPHRPLVALFTSSGDEQWAEEDWSQIFESQLEWIKETVSLFAKLPDYDLVIRVHPNTGSGDRQFLAGLSSLSERLPSNVRMVWPDDPISTYTLVDLAESGLVYGSTVGLEMAALGKPVLVAAHCQYYGCPFVISLEKVKDYPRLMMKTIHTAPSVDTMRLAYRFIYHFFLSMSIRFPLISILNVHWSRLKYSSLEALRPGKNQTLDSIVRSVWGDQPIYPEPDATHLSRSNEDENSLAEIMQAQTRSIKRLKTSANARMLNGVSLWAKTPPKLLYESVTRFYRFSICVLLYADIGLRVPRHIRALRLIRRDHSPLRGSEFLE